MTTTLVLIDLQNDYFPGGAMELAGADAAVANAVLLLEAFRRRELPIIHVQHIARRAGATFFLPGSTGADIHAQVQPATGERLITKCFPNAFRETALLDALRVAGTSGVIFAGMMTHMCVDTTVRAASDIGFKCLLAQDACATRDLTFGTERVAAASVQTAYLAGLHGAFASVRPAQELRDSI